ncbi:hypothetical protein ACVWXM_009661 [Bradyrhizobium sp. GM7.3]
MAHHRTLAVNEGAYHLDALGATLEFYGVGATLQEPTRVANRFRGTDVKAKKRHSGHQQRTRLAARGSQVVVHHHHADGKRVFESEADITNAVSDKDDVDHRVGNTRRARIISRRHRKAAPLHLPTLLESRGVQEAAAK